MTRGGGRRVAALAGAEHLWSACIGRLRDELADGTWKVALAGTHAHDLVGNRLVVSVPSALAKERIETRHLQRIHEVIAEVTGQPHEVVLAVGTEAAPADTPLGGDDPAPDPSGGRASTVAASAAASTAGRTAVAAAGDAAGGGD